MPTIIITYENGNVQVVFPVEEKTEEVIKILAASIVILKNIPAVVYH